MVSLIVIRYQGTSIDRLVNWAQFHQINYLVISNLNISITIKPGDLGIFITSDLFPEPKLLVELINGNISISQHVGFEYYTEENKWLPSFCIVTDGIDKVKEFTRCIGFITPSLKIKYVEGIASKSGVHLLNKRAGDILRPEARRDLLWDMVVDYWYHLNQKVVSHYYAHLWINACQCILLREGAVFHDSAAMLKQQSLFPSAFKRKSLGEKTIEEILKYLEEGIDLMECIRDDLTGYEAIIDFPFNLLSKHVLSMNGKVVVKTKSNLIPKLDPTVTVVSFYYDLGYVQKPERDYIDSINKFALLPHPLIFYGEEKVCKIVENLRKQYDNYTVVIVRKLEEWELVQKFEHDFADMDTSKGFKKSKRYSILTCNKFWAVDDAINRNPFFTNKFAWLDCGLYRHRHIAPEELIGVPLFKYTVFELDKVLMPSNSVSPGTSYREFENGIENVIAIAMIGGKEGWTQFLGRYMEFIETTFTKGQFYTEQVMISRLIGIFPDLIEPRLYGFNQSQFMSLLGISLHKVVESKLKVSE